jgi:integrase
MLSLVESTCMIKARDGSKKQDIASHLLPATAREKREAREGAMKLTRDTISALALPAGKADHIEWDDTLPGFGIRLRGDGKRWVVQYRVGTQQRRESLGDVRKITLEDARRIARQRFAQVELGVDPIAERARAHAAAMTLGVVIHRYLAAKQERLRPNSHNAAKRYLEQHWKPLHGRPLEAIKRADVAARLQETTKAYGRTSAARGRDSLSALYSWAMKEGLCEANPVLATNDPTEGMQARDRVLNDEEIRAMLNACEDNDSGRIVKLLLLTGCRREEIGGLKWSEVNLGLRLMTIPGTRTKNHRTLELTLPEIAIDILRSAKRLDDRDFVFGRRGFSGWSALKLRLDSRIVMATGKPLAPWRLHDLRRTMRTGLGKIGVQPHIAELAINHVRGGVEAIYDRHRYQGEIRAAFAGWAEHVSALREGRDSTLVSLHG